MSGKLRGDVGERERLAIRHPRPHTVGYVGGCDCRRGGDGMSFSHPLSHAHLHRALCIVQLKSPTKALFLMSEVPLYPSETKRERRYAAMVGARDLI